MEKKNCPNCGMDNNQIAKYCSSCGFELPKTESKTTMNVEYQKVSENKKNILPKIIGIIAFGVSFFAVQHFFFNKPSFEKAMVEIASELNKSCPIMVDQNTRLDNTMAMPNNVFAYNYTLVNLEKKDIDISKMKDFIEPNVVNNMKTNPDMKIYRENRTTMVYNYKDKNGIFLLRIDVTPEKYE
jgi:ribosomal protein L37E